MTARELLGAQPTNHFQVFIDGQPCVAYDGDTLAAVLMRSGRLSWRATRHQDEPRGLFCGMGACQDCLVSVGGVDHVRACLDPARPNDVVTTQQAGGSRAR